VRKKKKKRTRSITQKERSEKGGTRFKTTGKGEKSTIYFSREKKNKKKRETSFHASFTSDACEKEGRAAA